MAEDRYNGWTNHATWCAALHWSNDEGTYNWSREITEDALKEADGNQQAAAHLIADRLQEATEEIVDEAVDAIPNEWARLYITDNLPRGGDVNWHEIAEGLVAEFDE